MRKALLTLSLAAAAFLGNAQTIIYVDKDATGMNNGVSWASAYTSLEKALNDNTVTGAEIWIAEGTYTPSYSYTFFDIRLGEKLYGGFNGTETSLGQRNPELYKTILSGDINGDDANNVFTDNAPRIIRVIPYDPTGTLNDEEVVVLDGLTISDAYSTTDAGGGIGTDYPGVRQKGLRINGCIFENNTALYQSAFNFYTSHEAPVLEVSNSIFRNNVSHQAYLLEFRVNSVIGNAKKATFINNLFENNTTGSAVTSGGGIGGRFVNLTVGTFDIQYTNNTFVGNKNDAANFNKCLFVLERGGSANADIIIDFDNNLFYENEHIDNIAMDNNSNSSTKYVGANCLNNGGDWNQLNSFVGSTVSSTSPFEDYAAGDFRPTVAYATQGDSASYESTWTNVDLAGEERRDAVTGSIAIGAYQPRVSGVSLVERASVDLTIYPNPATNYLTITQTEDITEVAIYNMFGQRMLSQQNDFGATMKLDIADLPAGTYLMQANTLQGPQAVQFVKR
ncbi:hypothetical protein Oweho_1001 [Owenweeksia hongkongensis DSM 17368]|uniref:Secretion system C-terminal sorting domain-containing protein n=1 Tax=Owenweeksia hongkongensis (strain DSM 17368 / CIP 108786 / JCM 12287 / NRRL B-23963 / UST20020801) TaxID=926562 RepID=G8R3X9_OWEHD|nr:T9SS type A sorting domain-containing protein [Owenweeksia hongkongensis]AEV32011.1 hypothetical protein Oweho_1001 [Owenweeksia hongkongensis DSM 17368]